MLSYRLTCRSSCWLTCRHDKRFRLRSRQRFGLGFYRRVSFGQHHVKNFFLKRLDPIEDGLQLVLGNLDSGLMALLFCTRGDQLWGPVKRGHVGRELVNVSVVRESGMAVRCPSAVVVGEAQGEADEGEVLEKDHGE